MADPEQQGEWWERLRTGVCRECGQTFTTRASQRRYCTNVCRDAARVDRYKAQRDARRADPQAQRDHAARAKLYKSHASVEARWHARRFAVAFARSRRPWIARDAGGRRVRAGDTVMSFVVTRDLGVWIWAACRRLECAPAALIRCAIDYDRTGLVAVARAQRWRGRSTERDRLTVRMSVRQAAHLASAIRRPGYGGKSRALRRLLWTLRAALDPPVSA